MELPEPSSSFFFKLITLADGNKKKIVHLLHAVPSAMEIASSSNEWFIAKEIANVVLQLSPHYIRRRLNEEPLRDLEKWNTSNSHILHLISKLDPISVTPKLISLISKQTTVRLLNLMGDRGLASQFLITIGEKVRPSCSFILFLQLLLLLYCVLCADIVITVQ